MKLYHVSRDVKFSPYFEPRIPSLKDESKENRVIPRICFSTTLEGCFSAIPGAEALDHLLLEQRNTFRVYEIETDNYEISEDDIVLTDVIDENGWVHDAYLNDECWITKPFCIKNEDSYVVLIQTYSEEDSDCVSFEVRQLADEKYEGDLYGAFTDLNPDSTRIPCTTVIETLTLIDSRSHFPLTIDISFYNEHFSESLMDEEYVLMKGFCEENYPNDISIEELGDPYTTITFNSSHSFTQFCQEFYRLATESW